MAYYGSGFLISFLLAGIFASNPLDERFTNHRSAVIASIEGELSSGRYETVLDSTKSYLRVAPEDSSLLSLQSKAEKELALQREAKENLAQQQRAKEKRLKAELEETPSSNYELRESLYRRLVALDSWNKEYREKHHYYSQKVAEKAAKVAAHKKREKERQEKIDRQFSPWNGSNRPVTRAIKKRLKDPDSYEHIETRYSDKESYILVITRFRAKNSFGGYVINEAVAKTSIHGDVLSLEIQQ